MEFTSELTDCIIWFWFLRPYSNGYIFHLANCLFGVHFAAIPACEHGLYVSQRNLSNFGIVSMITGTNIQ